jgi:predicted MFS family arabinose efflux permease
VSATSWRSRPTGLARVFFHGPRGPFRWAAFVLAVTAFGAGAPTPLYAAYQHRFGFGATTLGLIFGAYTLGVFLTLFLLAPQAGRIGRKPLLALGMVLTAVAAALFIVADSPLLLALARIVSGLSVGATTSVATGIMGDVEPDHDEHHVARVAVAANVGGVATGVLLSGALVELAPAPTALIYLVLAGLAAVGLLATAALPRTEGSAGTWRIAVPRSLRGPFWISVGSIVATYALYGLFAAIAPSFLREGLGLTAPAAIGAVVALMFGSAAIVQLATAQTRDRRALLWGLPTMLVGLAILGVALRVDLLPVFLLATLVIGGSVGLVFMGGTTLIDRVAPKDQRFEILAGYYVAGYLAVAVPTLGVAFASDHIGLSSAGILFVVCVGAAVAAVFGGTYRTPTPPGGGGRPRRRARPAS